MNLWYEYIRSLYSYTIKSVRFSEFTVATWRRDERPKFLHNERRFGVKLDSDREIESNRSLGDRVLGPVDSSDDGV